MSPETRRWLAPDGPMIARNSSSSGRVSALSDATTALATKEH